MAFALIYMTFQMLTEEKADVSKQVLLFTACRKLRKLKTTEHANSAEYLV
jgi:hypothetical protein